MKLFISLVILFTSINAHARLRDAGLTMASRCSTADVDDLERLLVENELHVLRARRNFAPINYRQKQKVIIPVYVHVLAQTKNPEGGNVTDSKIKEQMAYLNDAYAAMNLAFELKTISRKIDKDWATFAAGEETIKKALRLGDGATLNLYIAGTTDGVLGWSYFPWEYNSFPHMDGVVIHFQTLPGGQYQEYNEGGTTVHEVGHWLGLYHVFQGGCSDGDMVKDTPAQREANFGCPKHVPDTCKDKDGVDSIHNFMDYSDDICMEGFSIGQIQRVHDNLESYRTP